MDVISDEGYSESPRFESPVLVARRSKRERVNDEYHFHDTAEACSELISLCFKFQFNSRFQSLVRQILAILEQKKKDFRDLQK